MDYKSLDKANNKQQLVVDWEETTSIITMAKDKDKDNSNMQPSLIERVHISISRERETKVQTWEVQAPPIPIVNY